MWLSAALVAAEAPPLPPAPPALPQPGTNRQARPATVRPVRANLAPPVPAVSADAAANELPALPALPTPPPAGIRRPVPSSNVVVVPPQMPRTRPPASLMRPPPGNYVAPAPDPTAIPGLTLYPPAGLLGGSEGPRLRNSAVPAPVRGGLSGGSAPAAPRQQENALAWDALVKEANLRPGETNGYFTFNFTNTSPEAVTILAVRTSCGCTTTKLPPLPWTIPAGTNGAFDVVFDVRGKFGVVTKTVTVETSAGYRYLSVRASVPTSQGAMASADRARNLQVALADRQSVLKGDCAVCHVTPGLGRQGGDLYVAVCGVCHEAEHRASMVPNLRALSRPMTVEDWRRIIAQGKKDSLMPAFAITEGGFMTDAQIDGLATYLAGPFKSNPPPALRVSAPEARPAGGLPTQ